MQTKTATPRREIERQPSQHKLKILAKMAKANRERAEGTLRIKLAS